jgi:O-antigen/teichoic acid export membrane protein
MMSDRQIKSILNSISGVISSIILILIGLLSQRIFAMSLGVEYLGINGLFTNIITMLGIVELGLGSAIIYHLYRPFAEHDSARIKSLLHFYKIGYRAVAAIIAAIGLLLIPFLPAIVGDITIPINITAVYTLFLADVVISYLLTYKRSLLYADQKSYLVNLAHLMSMVVMNTAQIAILIITKDFYLYLIIKIVMRIVENLSINAMVNNRYKFINEGAHQPVDAATKQDIFKKIKALFMHKIGTFIVLGSDNIIITVFFGITTVGLYSNYYLVIAAISIIIGQAFAAVTASVGNLLITSSVKKSYAVYKNVRFANFWLATVATTGMLTAMSSFVAVWLGQGYVLALGVLLALSTNLYLHLTRSTIASFKEAAGIFHEDRFVPLFESLVNIVLSIIFLHYFGLAGVFMGTICSNLVLHLFSYPKYVYTRLFELGYKSYYLQFVKSLAIATTIGAATFALSRIITIENPMLQLTFNIALSLLVPNIILYAMFRDSTEFIYFKHLIVNVVSKKTKAYYK